jgi:hypothetical protein
MHMPGEFNSNDRAKQKYGCMDWSVCCIRVNVHIGLNDCVTTRMP